MRVGLVNLGQSVLSEGLRETVRKGLKVDIW